MTSIQQRAADIAAEFEDRLSPVTDDPAAELWEARPALRHLHDFARARGVAPLAVLAAALARLVATVPAGMVLPPMVGGVGSVNLFVALVGPSGAGKGAAHAVAADAIDLSGWRDPVSGEELCQTGVGSGEGIVHQYARRERDGTVAQVREAVMFTVPEVDTLTALGARQGATLLPKLREVYSGEELSFAYVDPTKRLSVRAHSYRASLILGVQPGRAAALLDDANGGTPQRFLWVPVTDTDAPHPSQRPTEPQSITVPLPSLPPTMRRLVLDVHPAIRAEVIEAHWQRSRGKVGDELDGHRLYTRLKVAAALALLDGRLARGVRAEDWHLAGLLVAVSDRTRDEVRAELAARTCAANTARARAEADRAVTVDDAREAAATKRASAAILRKLNKRPGEWLSGTELRRALTSDARNRVADALEALVLTGQVEADEVDYRGQPGWRYRSRS